MPWGLDLGPWRSRPWPLELHWQFVWIILRLSGQQLLFTTSPVTLSDTTAYLHFRHGRMLKSIGLATYSLASKVQALPLGWRLRPWPWRLRPCPWVEGWGLGLEGWGRGLENWVPCLEGWGPGLKVEALKVEALGWRFRLWPWRFRPWVEGSGLEGWSPGLMLLVLTTSLIGTNMNAEIDHSAGRQ